MLPKWECKYTTFFWNCKLNFNFYEADLILHFDIISTDLVPGYHIDRTGARVSFLLSLSPVVTPTEPVPSCNTDWTGTRLSYRLSEANGDISKQMPRLPCSLDIQVQNPKNDMTDAPYWKNALSLHPCLMGMFWFWQHQTLDGKHVGRGRFARKSQLPKH